jgi:8-oxo-dGTP diphosphatase
MCLAGPNLGAYASAGGSKVPEPAGGRMDEQPSHIVAAAALVSRAPGEVLLVRTARRGWGLPGGQIEPGEGLLAGLRREILEETGIEATIGALAGLYSNVRPPTKVILGFLAESASGDLRPSPETPEVAWVPREGALEIVTHGAERDRLADLLGFDGQVAYRVYETRPYRVIACEKLPPAVLADRPSAS